MNKKLVGYLFLIGAAIIYGLFGLLSRYTGKFGPFSQGWVRYFLILFLLVLVFGFRRTSWRKIQKKDIKWFLIWILPASFQPILTFIAFNHLPLGIGYFLLYSTMILAGIISGKLFFSEKFGLSKTLSLLLVFAGLVLIYKSDITLITNSYVFIALISGSLVGFWNTLTKKVSNNYSEFQMMFLDGFSTFTVGLVGSLYLRETLPLFSDITSWFWIVAFAFSTIAAGFMLIRGFKHLEAQTGSLIMPLEIVFASLFGFIFFGELLKLNVYLGGLCIFLAAVLPAFSFSKDS